MGRKPRNVFEIYLAATENPLGWESPKSYEAQILELWRRWGYPPFVAVSDPRGNHEMTVYFVFYLGHKGPDFVLHYDMPTPESLAEKFQTES